MMKNSDCTSNSEMGLMKDYEAIEDILRSSEQSHLLKFWETLTEGQQKTLLEDIQGSSITSITHSFSAYNDSLIDQNTSEDSIESILDSCESVMDWSESVRDGYILQGLNAIREGEVAVVVLGGGQGTRLGSTLPKGMYDIGLASGKTLYQLLAERIIRLQLLASEECSAGSKSIIYFFVMTSKDTLNLTKQYFLSNNYFGLEASQVVFFDQVMVPCFSKDGKILLESKYKIAKSPNGNGGIFESLRYHNLIEDLESKAVKYVHVFSVDNILNKPADPAFIGFCVNKKADCAAKVVEKIDPDEKVGLICKRDGKYCVVEYSEFPQTLANRLDEDCRLEFRAGNICNHFFCLEFLRKLCYDSETSLRYHFISKKIPYVDENGKLIKPMFSNGIKLEKYIFDSFLFSKNFKVLEVEREGEFCAIKNENGCDNDTPEIARKALYALHRKFLVTAGGVFNENQGDVKDSITEISPLITYDGEGLEEYVKGKVIHSPFILDPFGVISK